MGQNSFTWLLGPPSPPTDIELLEDKGWAYVAKKVAVPGSGQGSMRELPDLGQLQARFLDSAQSRHKNSRDQASNGQNSPVPQVNLHPNHPVCISDLVVRP